MDDSLAERLGRFGFSDKEVDTYLTLLEHGEAKASTIADAADVSKRYVYSVSESLAERGFVEVNDHVVPTTIRATPPEEVVEHLQAELDRMESGLEERYSTTEPDAEQFEVIKSRVTVLKRIRSLVGEAEQEVILSIPAGHLGEVAEVLRAAVDRGVLVLLIVNDVDDSPDISGLASVARVWSEPMPTMLAVDRRIGVVAPTEMIARSNTDRQAIVFAQEQLGPVIVGSFFGNYWPVSREVAVADPDELPRTYTDFRHAVFQATSHIRAGNEVYAVVTGRATDEEAPVEVEGLVVDVRQGMVSPTNNDFPVENTLVLDTDGDTVTVGGQGAFVEDVEADEVTLEVA